MLKITAAIIHLHVNSTYLGDKLIPLSFSAKRPSMSESTSPSVMSEVILTQFATLSNLYNSDLLIGIEVIPLFTKKTVFVTVFTESKRVCLSFGQSKKFRENDF